MDIFKTLNMTYGLGQELTVLFFGFFFWCSWGFELRTPHLQSRCSTASATPPVHFALVIFEIGSGTICPGWPRTMILLICASEVVRITGVSQGAWEEFLKRSLLCIINLRDVK
jgi:hypothetical protein